MSSVRRRTRIFPNSVETADLRAGVVTAAKTDFSLNEVRRVVNVTATVAGDGTGVVPDGADVAVVTSANAAHVVTLPSIAEGVRVTLVVGANGCQLQSEDPATVAINGGAEANAVTTISANTLVECVSQAPADNWICTAYADDGTATALTPADDGS